MASDLGNPTIILRKREKSRQKKGVSFFLSTSEVLRNPHKIDKSKAHAVWREHFAHYSNLVFARVKFPRFRYREQQLNAIYKMLKKWFSCRDVACNVSTVRHIYHCIDLLSMGFCCYCIYVFVFTQSRHVARLYPKPKYSDYELQMYEIHLCEQPIY